MVIIEIISITISFCRILWTKVFPTSYLINQSVYGIKINGLSHNLTCMCRQIVSKTISSAVYTSTCFSRSPFLSLCFSIKPRPNIPPTLLYPVPRCGSRVFFSKIEPVKQMKITHELYATLYSQSRVLVYSRLNT